MKRYTQVQDTQMLTGGLEHFTVATPNSIVPTGDSEAAYGSVEFNNYYEQARVWEQIIEIFRTRGNVVIVSELTSDGFTVAVEHNDAIDPNVDANNSIQALIRDLGEVPFGVSAGADTDLGTEDDVQETVDLSSVVVTKVDYDLL